MKILLTSTSFQDTPGSHQSLLEKQGFEITKLRGPLKESELIDIIDQFDGIICGDDDITSQVIAKGVKGRLSIISKYGIGLDKIDLKAADRLRVPVFNCPGVNQVTVAEHVFALLLSYVKNILPEDKLIQNQQWERLIGSDVYGKTIGIFGLGNVGREVALRARAFGMKVIAFDKIRDDSFAEINHVDYCDTVEQLFTSSDILSLNSSLNAESKEIINDTSLNLLKKGVIIINTARAALVNQQTILNGISTNIIKGYLTDVLEEEPMKKNHPFLGNSRILITPHIGSRTHDNVVRQGTMAVENLLKFFKKV